MKTDQLEKQVELEKIIGERITRKMVKEERKESGKRTVGKSASNLQD